MSKFWKDYYLMDLDTPGGQRAIKDLQRGVGFPPPPSPEIPAPEPKHVRRERERKAKEEAIEKWRRERELDPPLPPTPPTPSFQASKLDFTVAALVWLITSVALWHSWGGVGAACTGMIAASVAIRWWKQLIVFAVIGGAILIWLNSK